MNILQLSYDYPPHARWGSGPHCARLAERLVATGDSVLVATPHFEGRVGYTSESKVDVLRVQVDYPHPAKQWTAIDEFRVKLEAVNAGLAQAVLTMKWYPIDVIHIHSWMVYPAADQLRRAWGCPLVATLHILEKEIIDFNDNPDQFAFAERSEALLLKEVDAAILPSQFLDSRIPEELLPKEKRHIIPVGVDLRRFARSKPEEYYEELRVKVAEGDDIALFVGRLNPQKGWLTLLEASLHVVEKRPNTIFAMVGRGKGMTSLLKMASTINNIVILGHLPQEDVFDLYQIADVVVVPSLFENFPAAVVEPLASGCSVVATNIGGISEIIKPGQNGLLVPVQWKPETRLPTIDPELLAEQILLLLNDKELAAQLGMNAREFVYRNLSEDIMIDTIRKLYKSLLSLRRLNT